MNLQAKYFRPLMCLLFCTVIVLAGCSTGNNTGTVSTQIVSVQRGNITNSITGTGYLALSRTSDLTFEIAGTVLEITVKESDSVTKNQVLASLDTSQWDEQIKNLENAVNTAERNLRNSERQIVARQLSVRQAELDLRSSQETASKIPVVKTAQMEVDNAKSALENALKAAVDDPSILARVPSIQKSLLDAENNLKAILSGTSYNLTTDIALQIARAQLNVEQSQRQLEDARIAVDDSIKSRDDSQQALVNARSNLTKGQSLSPLIKAPFDGFITKISISGGDEVKKGQLAMQIAEPDKFVADILVGESDIFQVNFNSNATVTIDALSGLSYPAKVIYISPTATAQQGVVNYRVRVEIQPQSQTPQQMNPPGFGQSDNLSREELINRIQESVKQGLMSQAQADQLIKQIREGNSNTGFTFQRPGSSTNRFSPQVPSIVNLKQGLSATVNIITAQKQDVLLVPSDAISRKGGVSVVTVRKDGIDEQRNVTTGISDWQYTEIVSGLREGEQVVITRSTSSSANRQMQQFGLPGGSRSGVVIR